MARVCALVGGHAADEEEVVVLVARSNGMCSTSMALGIVPTKRRSGKPLRWYSEMAMKARSLRSEREHLLRGGVGGAVQRGDHGRAEQAVHEGAHGPAGEAVVVVDDVELARLLVGGQAVHHLEVAAVLDLLEGGAREDVAEVRPRARVAAGEQRHVVPVPHQALGEQAHDELDAAVPLWRQREPGRGDHADAHRGPPVTRGRTARRPHAAARQRSYPRRRRVDASAGHGRRRLAPAAGVR